MKVDRVQWFYQGNLIKGETLNELVEEFMKGKEIVSVSPMTPQGIFIHWREEKEKLD